MSVKITKQSTKEVDFKLLKSYYEAVKEDINLNPYDLQEFKKAHPFEFSFFSCVSRKRKAVKSNLETLERLGRPLYFGTLTYNNEKDCNTQAYKRKEAFKALNDCFEYFLLVEEFGEENERYHIHFVGVFKLGLSFDDFVRSWHSRQNLEKVHDIAKTTAYLVKYVSKELPRIRRNKNLVKLDEIDKKVRRAEKTWCWTGKDNKLYKEREKIIQLSYIDML